MQHFDVIIIGAGAAGLMCAAVAQKRGHRVLVLERSENVGEKIRISGGGRCNFTNVHASQTHFLSENPRFCVSALKRYTQQDFIDLVDSHDITYHQRDHGQMFLMGRATQIIDMLLQEAAGCSIQTKTNVREISGKGNNFNVKTDRGSFTSASLVIATGGPSIPKIGATGFAYDIARQFGHAIIEPRPGLVPLTFDEKTKASMEGLSGISLPATVKFGKKAFSEALLFTHRGLSGPVILQISSYWRPGNAITIDLAPGRNVFEILKKARNTQPKRQIQTVLAEFLPKRLAQRLVQWADCDSRLAETSDKALRLLSGNINNWCVTPQGTEGMRTAEVTVGGIDTRELSSKTMQSNKVPGLYFIGEAVDVTGHLGGFNFQWAWSSGHACGSSI